MRVRVGVWSDTFRVDGIVYILSCFVLIKKENGN